MAMDCIMRSVFSLHVFKQMGAHTPHSSPAFIHSFKHSLAVKLCFLTIKYSSILKIIGLYTCFCQENMCLLYDVCRCIDLNQLITAVSAVPSQII
jgi:hypothetical protein